VRTEVRPSSEAPLDRAAKQRLVDELRPWHHSIDLGDGVVTPGGKTPAHHYDDMLRLHLPDLAGKSVIDIGAWDGYYTFMAEGAGASRVVALDHYVWSIDFKKATQYVLDRQASGERIRSFHTVPELWNPIDLPGKRGFDLAHRVLESRAEVVVDDFMAMDLEALGAFDVVLFLGVIYHLEEPLRALRRLREVTRGLAVIESEALLLPGRPGRALWQFVDADQLNDDPSNWWVPTAEGLRSMCLAAGFSRAEVVSGPPARSWFRRGRTMPYRLVVHAFGGL
jgi:tRNA (mo5U34)-methyltransferase